MFEESLAVCRRQLRRQRGKSLRLRLLQVLRDISDSINQKHQLHHNALQQSIQAHLLEVRPRRHDQRQPVRVVKQVCAHPLLQHRERRRAEFAHELVDFKQRNRVVLPSDTNTKQDKEGDVDMAKCDYQRTTVNIRPGQPGRNRQPKLGALVLLAQLDAMQRCLDRLGVTGWWCTNIATTVSDVVTAQQLDVALCINR